jgi:hypothetical protein
MYMEESHTHVPCTTPATGGLHRTVKKARLQHRIANRGVAALAVADVIAREAVGALVAGVDAGIKDAAEARAGSRNRDTTPRAQRQRLQRRSRAYPGC